MDLMKYPVLVLSRAGVKKPKVVIYGTIAVLGGLAILVIVSKLTKRAKDNAAARMTNALFKSNSEDQLSSIRIIGATLSKGDAIIISQNLVNAMDSQKWSGTDEQQIFDNLGRARNKADLELIIQTFGVLPYSGFGLATSWVARQSAKMKNLNGWLRAELSGADLRRVQTIFDNLGVPL
jgi:hypothetical protein